MRAAIAVVFFGLSAFAQADDMLDRLGLSEDTLNDPLVKIIFSEEKQVSELKDIAVKLAECNAIMEFSARITSRSEEEYRNSAIKEQANLASLAGYNVVDLAGYRPEMFDHLAKSRYRYWQLQFDADPTNDKSEVVGKMRYASAACKETSAVQSVFAAFANELKYRKD